jgi:hypothetical protein
MRRLANLLRRSPHQRSLLMAALGWVVVVRVALWCLPYGTVRRLTTTRVAPSPTPPPPRDGRDPLVGSVTAAVRSASRYVPRATCLTQALVAERMLARRGRVTTLRIGVVRDTTGALEAHAWLEHDGRVVIGDDGDLQRFALMPSVQEAPRRRKVT